MMCLRALLFQVAVPRATATHLEKERLKQLSDERAQRWPNTIEVRMISQTYTLFRKHVYSYTHLFGFHALTVTLCVALRALQATRARKERARLERLEQEEQERCEVRVAHDISI
jgi:hypothetical protein